MVFCLSFSVCHLFLFEENRHRMFAVEPWHRVFRNAVFRIRSLWPMNPFHVLCPCHWLTVLRVAADTVSAAMVEFQSFRDLAIGESVSHTVSCLARTIVIDQPLPRLLFAPVHSQHALPLRSTFAQKFPGDHALCCSGQRRHSLPLPRSEQKRLTLTSLTPGQDDLAVGGLRISFDMVANCNSLLLD